MTSRDPPRPPLENRGERHYVPAAVMFGRARRGETRTSWFDRLALRGGAGGAIENLILRGGHALAVCAALAGAFLLFADLDRNGSTWDERVDFRISRNIAKQRSLLIERSDPSQSRLPHIVGAISIATLGTSLWSFKFPFAVAGLLSGWMLYAFLARRRGATVGLYALAYYMTNPWMLASSRSAATAGDILVVATTFAFLWAAIRVYGEGDPPRRLLGRTAGFGLLAGLAVGAKLTNLALLPAGLVLVAFVRRSLVHMLVYAALAVLTAIALHPLLVTQTENTLGASIRAFGMTPIALEGAYAAPAVASAPVSLGSEPIEVENTPKLRYLYTLLVAKLTLPFLLLVGIGAALGLVTALKTRRLDPAFFGALAFVLVPCAVLIWKYTQNANYYLPILLPAITIAVIPLEKGLRATAPGRRLATAVIWLAIVGYQLALSIDLAPDYLQAGRRLGPAAQGEMAGPAVNHCQGGPLLFDDLNRLKRGGLRFDTFYVFETCLPMLVDDSIYGPVPLEGYRFKAYVPGSAPKHPHILVVHEVVYIYQYGMPRYLHLMRALKRATKDCTLLNPEAPHARYKIYRCPARA